MKKIVLVLILVVSTVSFAASEKTGAVYQVVTNYSDEYLHKLYQVAVPLADSGSDSIMAMRVKFFAETLLQKGSPYLEGPLGEGRNGEFAQEPLYRLDGFDCTTFVETVISLARSTNENQFKEEINKIRYKNGQVSFENRNHFPSVDWIPNNIKAGFVSDITNSIAGAATKLSETLIEKDEWYCHKGTQFAALVQGAGKAWGQIFYVAKEDLLAHPELIEKIPSGSVFNVVRPNWDLRAAIGTRLDVSHQGFLIRENGVLYMIHASNGASRDGSDNSKRVKKDIFSDYVRAVMMASPTTAGVNILQVRAP